VPSLPPAESAEPSPIGKGRLEPLWEGDDLALHTSLLDALDAAKIPYFNKPLSVYPGVRRADPFPVQPLTLFGYKVAVLSSDFRAAKQILEKLLDQEPKDEMELPAEPEPSVSESPPRTPSDEAEEPTVQVWRGNDEDFAHFLQDALRENDMPLRTDDLADETAVFVRPSDAARAQEIVRELREASPPC